MLNWSYAQYKFTLGIGSLATTAIMAELWKPLLPVWLVVVVALVPFAIFFFAQPGEMPDRLVRVAQIFASIWYLLTLIALSVGLAFAPRLPEGWIVFPIFGGVGLIPCVLVLAKAFRGQGASEVDPAASNAEPELRQPSLIVPQRNASDREFTYQPRWGVIIGCAGFFTACGLVLRSMAISNDRGLIISGILHLSLERATIFYWVLTWTSFGFVALAACMLVARMLNPQKLVLASEGLYAPKRPWSREPNFIRYGDILSISSYKVSRQEFLKIVHVGGKQNVTASMLESKLVFEEFCKEFALRVQAAMCTRR